MAAGVRSDCGDVDEDGTLLSPPSSSQPTCCELRSTDSKTPNPRPTKTMKMEESSNPPPDLVDLEAPTPKIEDESSKEKSSTGEGESEGRAAEPEKEALIDYDTDDIDLEASLAGLATTEFGSESESDTEEDKAFWARARKLSALLPVLEYKKCDICFEEHYTAYCPYSSTIPYGKRIPNDEKYVIQCPCGALIDDGGPCSNKHRVAFRSVVHRELVGALKK